MYITSIKVVFVDPYTVKKKEKKKILIQPFDSFPGLFLTYLRYKSFFSFNPKKKKER